MGKIFVVFRSRSDAQRRSDGRPWVEQLSGYPVDETVSPYGGIILKEVRQSGSNVIYEPVTRVKGYGPEGSPIYSVERVPHKRKVLRTEKGEDGKTTVYVCEPCYYDAEQLAKLRPDWWPGGPFKDESEIPRGRQDLVGEVVREAEPVVEAEQTATEEQAPAQRLEDTFQNL